MYRKSLLLVGAGLGLLLGSGCATKESIYAWGSYEEQLYLMYKKPEQAAAEAQIERLEADLELARAEDKPLPPGMRAHMGFMYFQLGRYDEAKQAFEAEKVAFPESSRLMDRFIDQLKPKSDA